MEISVVGKLCISEPGKPRKTAGKFSDLIIQNASVFRQYFGEKLFPGSLNVAVAVPTTLQIDLDARRIPPALVIPRCELQGMPTYIGDDQAWRCTLQFETTSPLVRCWVFRRIGSQVPRGILEVVASLPLVKTYGLRDGQAVQLTLSPGTDDPLATSPGPCPTKAL